MNGTENRPMHGWWIDFSTKGGKVTQGGIVFSSNPAETTGYVHRKEKEKS